MKDGLRSSAARQTAVPLHQSVVSRGGNAPSSCLLLVLYPYFLCCLSYCLLYSILLVYCFLFFIFYFSIHCLCRASSRGMASSTCPIGRSPAFVRFVLVSLALVFPFFLEMHVTFHCDSLVFFCFDYSGQGNKKEKKKNALVDQPKPSTVAPAKTKLDLMTDADVAAIWTRCRSF